MLLGLAAPQPLQRGQGWSNTHSSTELCVMGCHSSALMGDAPAGAAWLCLVSPTSFLGHSAALVTGTLLLLLLSLPGSHPQRPPCLAAGCLQGVLLIAHGHVN